MRIIIIGGVAAGTSVAAKARRNSEDAEICIYERGNFISYSTCGMPYLIGRDDISAGDLVPRDPEWFRERFRIDIRTGCEVTGIDPERKEIRIREISSGRGFSDSYDQLVLATGSRASVPPVRGAELPHVFTLKTMEDSLGLDSFIDRTGAKTAVVAGSGFIGLEICENLIKRGLEVRLIEAKASILPILDRDMGMWIEEYMMSLKIPFHTAEPVSEITASAVRTSSGLEIPADLVVIAAGVRPDTALAESCGVELDELGAIRVDSKMRTSVPGIFAAGDCAGMRSAVTGEPVYRPMGSTANKTGRIAGDSLTGGSLEFRGVLGTGILKFFDLQIGLSGLTRDEALKKGIDAVTVHCIKENQSKYLPESRELVIKALAGRADGRLLGVQIIGEKGVDKRLDVFAAAMSFGATAADLFHLDLAYAPPFSTTKDPVMYTGMILDNAVNRGRPLLLPEELSGCEEDYQIVDVRSEEDYLKAHIEGAVSIPLAELRERIGELDKKRPVVTHCNKGVTGNAAQNLLLNSGFPEVYNLSGGFKNYRIYKEYIEA